MPSLGDAKSFLLLALGAIAVVFVAFLVTELLRRRRAQAASGGPVDSDAPTPGGIVTGFVTNFFDTLGIGSYAPTTSIFRIWKMVPDERIPGRHARTAAASLLRTAALERAAAVRA